jgi:TDG/mug DNA glycosylase family protein
MQEKHPFGVFIPKHAKYLILGSFPGKPDKINNWFYGSPRNQFWPILEAVYKQKLGTIHQKQYLLIKLHFAITDVILSCVRLKGTNSDMNLTSITYNTKAVERILAENNIKKIFLTSRFSEKIFGREFKSVISLYPEVKLITLPSPSPRYAILSLSDKIKKYQEIFPKS